jgi:hypothetical protein
LGDDLGLALEPGSKILIMEKFPGEDFDGDLTVKARVKTQKDGSHAPSPEF